MEKCRILYMLLGLLIGINARKLVFFIRGKINNEAHTINDDELDSLNDRQFIEYMERYIKDA